MKTKIINVPNLSLPNHSTIVSNYLYTWNYLHHDAWELECILVGNRLFSKHHIEISYGSKI